MKKGFTLVELLAVIVILSIIAVITIPMIKGVIDKVKLGSLEDSVYGLKSAAELYYSSNEKIETTEFICSDNGCISNTGKKLDYKGRVEGKVKLFRDGKVSICLTSDNYASSILAKEKKSTTKMGGCDEETYEISEVIAIEKYNEIKNGVELLKNSLYNKTIISSKENTFEIMANEINNIELGKNEEQLKSELYNSLQYSGLVTEGMSYSEMLQVLMNKYPKWDGSIFNNGLNENVGIISKTYSSSSSSYMSANDNTIDVYCYGGGENVYTSYITYMLSEPVNVANFDLLKATNISLGGASGSWGAMYTRMTLGLSKNQKESTSFDHSANYANTSGVYVSGKSITLDVSSLTGEYYVYIMFEFYKSTGWTGASEGLPGSIGYIGFIKE